MKAMLIYREQEPRESLERFDGIERQLWAEQAQVERYGGITRLCPIPLDLNRAYLTECTGNYLKLAARIKQRVPDCEIYDVSAGGRRFETDWRSIDANTVEPAKKHIYVEGEPKFEEKEGQKLAVIVKFPAESPWKELLWNGIHEGLHESGWNIRVERMTPSKTVENVPYADMIFQWAAKQAQVENYRRFAVQNPDVLNVCVEHGYWRRTANCVLMPKLKRTPLKKKRSADQYKIKGRKKRQYYVIPMQVHGDEQLKDLEKTKPVWDWVRDVYQQLKLCTDKPVKVRPHPVRREEALNTNIPKEDILDLGDGNRWEESTIERDLLAAYGVVTWNSTFIADAMLHDVPVIQMGKREETWDYTLHDISRSVCEDIEGRGSGYKKMLSGYKKIVPLLAGQQMDYEQLKEYDWNTFYKEYT